MKHPFVFLVVDTLLVIGYMVVALMYFVRQLFGRGKSRSTPPD